MGDSSSPITATHHSHHSDRSTVSSDHTHPPRPITPYHTIPSPPRFSHSSTVRMPLTHPSQPSVCHHSPQKEQNPTPRLPKTPRPPCRHPPSPIPTHTPRRRVSSMKLPLPPSVLACLRPPNATPVNGPRPLCRRYIRVCTHGAGVVVWKRKKTPWKWEI